MKRMLFTVMLCCLILPGLLMAQGVTSAAFNGLVTDNDGNPIVGATITALHMPTGTVYTAVSRMDGLFNIPAVKVGGPYTVTVSMEPFKTQELTGITLKLGEDRNLKFKLALETIAEEITVIASNPIISESRTGAAQNVTTGHHREHALDRPFVRRLRPPGPPGRRPRRRRLLGRRQEQPIQQHPDRRRREQRPVRPGAAAAPPAWPRRSRSTPCRSSSWSSPPTTSARAASPAAA